MTRSANKHFTLLRESLFVMLPHERTWDETEPQSLTAFRRFLSLYVLNFLHVTRNVHYKIAQPGRNRLW